MSARVRGVGVVDEISIKNRILELHNSGYDTKDEEKRLEKLLKNIKKSK